MDEIWKVIPEFPSYEASSLGRIRNKRKGNILSQTDGGNGYLSVTLYYGKYFTRTVHTLVAKAHIPNPLGKKTVNHINKIRCDNKLSNLEWATFQEQYQHRVHHKDNSVKGINKGNIIIDYIGEEWRFIDFLDGDYYVSTFGRIRNKKGDMITGSFDGRGYQSVCLKGHRTSVHKLMAITFLGLLSDDNGKVVNHLDGNKSNNVLTNLEVTTQSKNILHAYQNNLITKLNKRQVIQVDYKGNIAGLFDSLTEAEELTLISRGCIHHAIEFGNTSKGHMWFDSMERYQQAILSGQVKNTFKVLQCDIITGNIVDTFDSYPEAFKKTAVSITNIARSAKTHLKAGGYKWFKCYKDYETWNTSNTDKKSDI